jgi:hypothetical protein
MQFVQIVCLSLVAGSCLAGPITSDGNTSALSVHDIGARDFSALQCDTSSIGLGVWLQRDSGGSCNSAQVVFTGMAQDIAAAPINLHTSATPDMEQPVHGMTVVSDRRRGAFVLAQRREPTMPLPALAAR